jgi:hypothetical protein
MSLLVTTNNSSPFQQRGPELTRVVLEVRAMLAGLQAKHSNSFTIYNREFFCMSYRQHLSLGHCGSSGGQTPRPSRWGSPGFHSNPDWH